MRAVELHHAVDIEELVATPGVYVAEDTSPAYGQLWAAADAGSVDRVGEATTPDGHKKIAVRVGPRRNPDWEEGSIEIGNDYFDTAKRDYSNWREKWWREAVQNAVDAGAKNVRCEVRYLDENGNSCDVPAARRVEVSCEDDGRGMSKEILFTKFLRLGGSGKRDTAGATGGFGKAKELLLLPWVSWRIESQADGTPGVLVEGTGAQRRSTAIDRPRGTRISVVMTPDDATSASTARNFIAKCFIPTVKFTVNGEIARANLRTGDLLRELDRANVYYNKRAEISSGAIFVRDNGIFMHERWVEIPRGVVIIELTGPSTDLMTANRDGLREWSLRSQIDALANELAADTRSALRKKGSVVREVYAGAGQFKLPPRERIEVAVDAMPYLSPTPSGKVAEETQDALIKVLEDMGGTAGTDRPGGDLDLRAPADALRAMMEAGAKGSTGVINIARRAVWQPDFFIYNDDDDFRVSTRFRPEKMTPSLRKLARLWAEFCRFVLIQLGYEGEYGVGWIFSRSAGASYLNHDGKHWLLLNPFRNSSALDGDFIGTTDQEDIDWLYALAVHEATHLNDGIALHNEEFASAFTMNVAKTANRGAILKKIRKAVVARSSDTSTTKDPTEKPAKLAYTAEDVFGMFLEGTEVLLVDDIQDDNGATYPSGTRGRVAGSALGTLSIRAVIDSKRYPHLDPFLWIRREEITTLPRRLKILPRYSMNEIERLMPEGSTIEFVERFTTDTESDAMPGDKARVRAITSYFVHLSMLDSNDKFVVEEKSYYLDEAKVLPSFVKIISRAEENPARERGGLHVNPPRRIVVYDLHGEELNEVEVIRLPEGHEGQLRSYDMIPQETIEVIAGLLIERGAVLEGLQEGSVSTYRVIGSEETATRRIRLEGFHLTECRRIAIMTTPGLELAYREMVSLLDLDGSFASIDALLSFDDGSYIVEQDYMWLALALVLESSVMGEFLDLHPLLAMGDGLRNLYLRSGSSISFAIESAFRSLFYSVSWNDRVALGFVGFDLQPNRDLRVGFSVSKEGPPIFIPGGISNPWSERDRQDVATLLSLAKRALHVSEYQPRNSSYGGPALVYRLAMDLINAVCRASFTKEDIQVPVPPDWTDEVSQIVENDLDFPFTGISRIMLWRSHNPDLDWNIRNERGDRNLLFPYGWPTFWSYGSSGYLSVVLDQSSISLKGSGPGQTINLLQGSILRDLVDLGRGEVGLLTSESRDTIEQMLGEDWDDPTSDLEYVRRSTLIEYVSYIWQTTLNRNAIDVRYINTPLGWPQSVHAAIVDTVRADAGANLPRFLSVVSRDAAVPEEAREIFEEMHRIREPPQAIGVLTRQAPMVQHIVRGPDLDMSEVHGMPLVVNAIVRVAAFGGNLLLVSSLPHVLSAFEGVARRAAQVIRDGGTYRPLTGGLIGLDSDLMDIAAAVDGVIFIPSINICQPEYLEAISDALAEIPQDIRPIVIASSTESTSNPWIGFDTVVSDIGQGSYPSPTTDELRRRAYLVATAPRFPEVQLETERVGPGSPSSRSLRLLNHIVDSFRLPDGSRGDVVAYAKAPIIRPPNPTIPAGSVGVVVNCGGDPPFVKIVFDNRGVVQYGLKNDHSHPFAERSMRVPLDRLADEIMVSTYDDPYLRSQQLEPEAVPRGRAISSEPPFPVGTRVASTMRLLSTDLIPIPAHSLGRILSFSDGDNPRLVVEFMLALDTGGSLPLLVTWEGKMAQGDARRQLTSDTSTLERASMIELNPARGLIENPPWVTKMLARHYEMLQENVPPQWLPKIKKMRAGKGVSVSGQIKEYGCGVYGCVLPTLDKNVVLKLTTDQSEAQFAMVLADNMTAKIVVKYHMYMELPGEIYKKNKVYLLWRDVADYVGKIDEYIDQHGGDGQAALEAIHRQHEAANRVNLKFFANKLAPQEIKEWKKETKRMAKEVPELASLANGMITAWEKDGVFMGDVHSGNIGLVGGEWVIVDPGNVTSTTDPNTLEPTLG